MISPPKVASTLNGYQLRLPTFEGPLDVLLRLIEREQLAISEISLLAVLDQFMSFMHSLNSPPSEVIADFLAVAGRLSVLKSRALLPRPAKPAEDQDEPDIVRQLEEYRAVKAAAKLLADRQRMGSGEFGRGHGVAWPPAEPARLAPQPPITLVRAVRRWLTRVPLRPVLVPTYRIVSLREMIARIASAVALDQKITFERIRVTCSNRQDVAVAFLAMLTLLRRQAIIVNQAELFGSITLSRTEMPPSAKPQSMPRESYGGNGTGRPPG